MKIACDACDAKYSIADDKVRGKVFKIRCKKCSNVIVVRGVAEEVPEPAPSPVAPDAIWHFVIDGDQVGPLALETVREKLSAGELDGETYAWSEGQADWQPLSQVPELAALITPAATEPLAEPAHDVLAQVSARDNVQRMKAERNESSVLFSLSNLSQIATRGTSPPPASATTASSTPGQEGSGLIDIRSMASAYLGTPGMTMKQAPGSIDDLPVFATATTFSEPAVLVPLAAPASSKKMLYGVIAAAAAFAAVALVLLVLVLKKSEPVATTPPPASRPQVAQAEAPPPPKPEEHVVAPPPPPAPPVERAAEAPKPEPKHADNKAKHVDVPKQLQPVPVKEDKCDEVHCLVDSSAPCCQKARPTPAATADALNKQMIQQAMGAIKARVLACGTTAHGRAHVKIHVSPTGRVDEANVDQSVSAGVDACIERVVKSASFPATKNGGGFGVPYDL